MFEQTTSLLQRIHLEPFPRDATSLSTDQLRSYMKIFMDLDILSRVNVPRCATISAVRKVIQKISDRDSKMEGRPRTWFVLLQRQPIGVFYYHHPSKDHTEAFIAGGILSSQTHQGLGTEMLQAGLEQLKRYGFRVALANVEKDNAASLAVLKKNGFRLINESEDYYEWSKLI